MEEISSIFSIGINYIRYIRIADIVDILLVAYLIYKAIWFVRKTNSHNLARGILLLLFVLLASYILRRNCDLSRWLFFSSRNCGASWNVSAEVFLITGRYRVLYWKQRSRRQFSPAKTCLNPRQVL